MLPDNNDHPETHNSFLKPALRAGFVLLSLAAPAFAQLKPPSVPIRNPSTQQEQRIAGKTRDAELALQAIAALKRLEQKVLIYPSLGSFEEKGKLARVSFEVLKSDLQDVMAYLDPILTDLAAGRLKREITNALHSYRDGVFWWSKIHQPRVVSISALPVAEMSRTPTDASHASTVPYTVAIHWRQASKYLKRAEQLTIPRNDEESSSSGQTSQ